MIKNRIIFSDSNLDRFRDAIKKRLIIENKTVDITSLQHSTASKAVNLSYEFRKSRLINTSDAFPYYEQDIVIRTSPLGFSSLDEWKTYLNDTIELNAPKMDHYYEFLIPEKVKNTTEYHFERDVVTYRIEPRYHYVAEKYEDHITNKSEKT